MKHFGQSPPPPPNETNTSRGLENISINKNNCMDNLHRLNYFWNIAWLITKYRIFQKNIFQPFLVKKNILENRKKLKQFFYDFVKTIFSGENMFFKSVLDLVYLWRFNIFRHKTLSFFKIFKFHCIIVIVNKYIEDIRSHEII